MLFQPRTNILAQQQDPLPKKFTCLFCNHEESVLVSLDKKAGVGQLDCAVCGQTFQCAINCKSLCLTDSVYLSCGDDSVTYVSALQISPRALMCMGNGSMLQVRVTSSLPPTWPLSLTIPAPFQTTWRKKTRGQGVPQFLELGIILGDLDRHRLNLRRRTMTINKTMIMNGFLNIPSSLQFASAWECTRVPCA